MPQWLQVKNLFTYQDAALNNMEKIKYFIIWFKQKNYSLHEDTPFLSHLSILPSYPIFLSHPSRH